MYMYYARHVSSPLKLNMRLTFAFTQIQEDTILRSEQNNYTHTCAYQNR